MLQEKAKRANEELGDATFKASNGWLDRFKKRYNITSKVISGEAGGVSEETVASWKERLPSILSGYSPENVLNMDETGQFYQALPNRSLAEVSKQCTGGKNPKKE
ncbi:tigger transposable element-derived protein 4-like [Montipora foliosa]|uniref:tigger transposable element-derived protein 4-like n=1 Tax=Montipora foliosa TaxID=591990 RepID=UPI0035F19DED